MCGNPFKTPSMQSTPPVAEAPKLPETPRSPGASTVSSQADADKRRRAIAAGQGTTSTILTGPRGIQNGGTILGKQLMGE